MPLYSEGTKRKNKSCNHTFVFKMQNRKITKGNKATEMIQTANIYIKWHRTKLRSTDILLGIWYFPLVNANLCFIVQYSLRLMFNMLI